MMFFRKSRRALCFSALHLLVVLAFGCAVAASPSPVRADTLAVACKQTPTDDTLRPLPENLAGAVNKAFGTSMPASVVAATTVYRCYDAQILVCTAGANLPCGQADTSRTPSPGTAEWCKQNPDSDFIPAVVTGHATIFTWRCAHGTPQIERQVFTVDARGFVSQYWKQLP